MERVGKEGHGLFPSGVLTLWVYYYQSTDQPNLNIQGPYLISV